MFIDWASQLSLLQHDPEAHILKEFSLPVQKVLVSQVVTHLLEPKVAAKVLSSPSHVCWAMETCGQGFSLPIEEEESITKVISFYRMLALEPSRRPSSIDGNPQFFLQKILQHYSLLFEPRATTREGIEKHAALCSTVLDIFVNIGRSIGTQFSVETWELFLKLLIGITDLILRPDAPPLQEPLQKKLCPQLLKVLFELWLLSRTRNPDLWSALKQRVHKWTHHMALILTWKLTCISLTKRSAAILYGPAEGTESVIISIDDSVQKLPLEDEYVFYSWHRMLNLIGNPNETIHHPAIFLDFMNGVEILVSQYLKIGLSRGQEHSRYLPPTGNTILHIFGTWLFDAIHLDRDGFDEGTALATKTLTSMMAQKCDTNFLPVYSSAFFGSMQHALSGDGRVLITAIVSSTSLFTLDIKGIRCLVPSYMQAITRICTGKAKLADQVMAAEQVRKACLSILGTIISLPNQFGSTPFYIDNDLARTVSDVHNYVDLKPKIAHVLLEALDMETYEPNLETLLGLVMVWQMETLAESSDFTKKSVKLILRKVRQSHWVPSVGMSALRVLGQMSHHYESISRGSHLANSVVDTLCQYILTLGNPCPSPQDQLSSLSFQCIAMWAITKDQWILEQTETRQTLLKAIVVGLTGKRSEVSPAEAIEASNQKTKKTKEKRSKTEEKQEKTVVIELSELIRNSAKRTLHNLINDLGNFPTASGAASYSTLATEEEVLQDVIASSNDQISIEEAKQYMRYFITDDNVILCVIDRRYFDEKPSVCLIVRDETGRYTWDAVLSHLPLNPAPPPQDVERMEIPELTVCATPYTPQSQQAMTPEQLSNVLGFLGKDTERAAAVIREVQQEVDEEEKKLQENQFHLNEDVAITIPAPADPFLGACKIQQSRAFLSHLGFLSLENRDKLFPLTMGPSLFNLVRQLDQQAERTCIRVGVLYIEKDQTMNEAWYGNEGGNIDYQQFVATLGWGVDLVRHHGYSGSLDVSGSMTGRVAPYWADLHTEILFQCCTLMPNNPTYADHAHKRKQSIHSHCIVIWVEDLASFQPAMLWKRLRHNALAITITPLESGLYLVRMFSKGNDLVVGPLVDGMVLRKSVLGDLIRATAVNAWELLENPQNVSPTQPRQDLIEKINTNCKQIGNLEQFYAQQFTELPPETVGPLQVNAAGLRRSSRSPRQHKRNSDKTKPIVDLPELVPLFKAPGSKDRTEEKEEDDSIRKSRRRKEKKKKPSRRSKNGGEEEDHDSNETADA